MYVPVHNTCSDTDVGGCYGRPMRGKVGDIVKGFYTKGSTVYFRVASIPSAPTHRSAETA